MVRSCQCSSGLMRHALAGHSGGTGLPPWIRAKSSRPVYTMYEQSSVQNSRRGCPCSEISVPKLTLFSARARIASGIWEPAVSDGHERRVGRQSG